MRNRKNIVTYMVAALSILVTSASSSPAAPAQTYHGTFTGGTFYCDGNPVPVFTVTGNWNVNIDPRRRPWSRSTSSTMAAITWRSGTTR